MRLRRIAAATLLAMVVACSKQNAALHPDSLVIALPEPISLDPLYLEGIHAYEFSELGFSYLTNYDSSNDVVPDVAQEVPTKANGGISPDGKIITFHLRHGVTWQDRAALTARDVVFTYHAVMNAQHDSIALWLRSGRIRDGAGSLYRHCAYGSTVLADHLMVHRRRQQLSNSARNVVVNKTTHGLYGAETGMRGLFTWAYDPSAGNVPYDPSEAAAMLESDGWKAGPDGIRYKGGRRLENQLADYTGTAEPNDTSGGSDTAFRSSSWTPDRSRRHTSRLGWRSPRMPATPMSRGCWPAINSRLAVSTTPFTAIATSTRPSPARGSSSIVRRVKESTPSSSGSCSKTCRIISSLRLAKST